MAGDEVNSFLEIPGQYPGYEMDALQVDQAYLTVTSDLDTNIYLYGINEDCINCPYQQLEPSIAVPPNNSSLFTVSTKRGWDLLVSRLNTSFLDPANLTEFQCSLPNRQFGEFGVYELRVGEELCELQTLKEPVFIYGGMIIAAVVYMALLGIVAAYPYLAKKISRTGLATFCRRGDSESQVDLHLDSAQPAEPKKPVKQRVKSLDTFRGLSIALMILVNYNAGMYWFMEHATWDGLLVADLVFPWFLWIMGVCIPMGLKSALRRKVPKWKIFMRIVKRSVKLFMLGIILNSLGGWVTLSQYRVPGILQRFAICYLVVAGVALFIPEPKPIQHKMGQVFSDVIALAWQWLFYLVLVAIHVVVMFCVPVPGCPTGYIGPGGVDLVATEGKALPDCIGGITGYVDRWLLGVEHLYQHPTAKHIYSSGAFDPEGVFGSMLSVFQVFLGLVAGNVLQFHSTSYSRMGRWMVWCVICGIIGTILSYAGMEGAPIPLNKNLWSLSYVMVTSCFAFFLLALFYLLIDELKIWSGSPLYQAGMNSIFLYVGHNVTYNLFPWHYIIGPMRTHAALLAECLWGTTLWIITALYLHHIGKFYTV